MLAIYMAILLVWPWAPERFLLPFLTIFFAGLWVEARRMAPILTANLRRGVPTSQRVIAGALTGVLGLVIGYGAWNFFVRDPVRLRLASDSLAHNLEQREEAYAWLRQNADPKARVTAYEDAVLYLYSGRQGLRPIAFLPESGYLGDRDSMTRDLAHIADAPRYAEPGTGLRLTTTFTRNGQRIDTRPAGAGRSGTSPSLPEPRWKCADP